MADHQDFARNRLHINTTISLSLTVNSSCSAATQPYVDTPISNITDGTSNTVMEPAGGPDLYRLVRSRTGTTGSTPFVADRRNDAMFDGSNPADGLDNGPTAVRTKTMNGTNNGLSMEAA